MSRPFSFHLLMLAIKKPEKNYAHLLEIMKVNTKHGAYTQQDCRCAECLTVTPEELKALNEKLQGDLAEVDEEWLSK